MNVLNQTKTSPDVAVRRRFFPGLTAVAIFLIALVLSAVIIFLSEKNHRQVERARVLHIARDHAFTLQLNIERALSATYSLAALVRQGKGNVPDFDATAGELLPFYPGAASLQLAPDGVVRQIVPLAGNEGAIGHDLLKDRTRNKEAFLARDTGKLTLAGPFDLLQGGVGAVGRLPVFLDKEGTIFWGFISVVIRFPEILDPAQLSSLVQQDFDYELWRIHPDTGKRQIIAASLPGPLVDPVNCSLKLPNGVWNLSVAPAKGWGNPLDLAVKVALGLAFSFLLFFLTRFQLKARAEALRAARQLTCDLQESEIRYASVVNAMAEGFFMQMRDGEITAANPAAERILGRPLAQIMGSVFGNTHCEAIHGDGSPFTEDCHPSQVALTTGEPQNDVIMGVYRHDGSLVWLSINSRPLIAAGDTIPYAVVTTFHDITERNRAEEALRKSEQKFRAIFDHTFQFIGLIDTEGIVLDVNRSALALNKTKESEVVGKFFWETPWWTHSSVLQEQLRLAVKKAAEGEFLQFEATHPDYGGNIHYIDFSLKPVWDQDGKVVMIIPEGRDVTRRRLAEEEIRNLNQKLEERVLERTVELNEKNSELSLEVHERKQAEKELREAKECLEETNRMLETLSITDHLTGLANRRYFDEALTREYARHLRSGTEVSMIMLDIDFFKAYNDSYGHVYGDACLQQISLVMGKCASRAVDIVARYGGEEFACILPETNRGGAVVIAEKIRSGIIGLAIPHESSSISDCVTASLGVITVICTADTPPSDVVVMADKMLYKAKLNGRNRVESAALINRPRPGMEKNPVRLEWNDIYCSGNSLIDAQHRNFFETSNSFLNAMQASRPNSEISQIVEDLLEDIAQHFRDEEALLASINFPGLKAHADKHALLYKRGMEMAQSLHSETPFLGDTFKFLVYEVVFQHMYLADREFFPFLNKESTDPQ
ncbi:MAG: diguanylate cyclase [Desulfocapsaceae bacterium]|nr:diguanylate cyclase [Desulfocapsaceae bacterium]